MLGINEHSFRIYFGTADERTTNWPLVGPADSPRSMLYIVAAYFSLLVISSWIMKQRQPFSLKRVMLVYNLGITLINAYIFVEIVASSVLQRDFNLWCQNVDRSDNPVSLRLASAFWLFYVSKIIDFSDTFFCILRHKWKQVTFLHVYHHCTIFPLWWLIVHYAPGGWGYYTAMFNSFVHVVMYSYYFLAALGPQVAKYLWWKRYVTQLQMIQFLTFTIHSVVALYLDCGFPRGLLLISVCYCSSLLLLFANFYLKSYKLVHRLGKAMDENSNKQDFRKML